MIINHNMNAMNAHRNMGMNTVNSGKSMEKLSSGLRINRAGDDAAGLAISEKMRGQIRGLDQASRNAQDGISLIQTAEGALNETHSILQRMRELSVQAANDTNNDSDRGQIQKEIDQLTAEIDRIGNTTEFNTKKLLNGDSDVKATVADSLKDQVSILGASDKTKVGSEIVIDTATKAEAASNETQDIFATNKVGTGGVKIEIETELGKFDMTFAAGTKDEDIVDAINKSGKGVTAKVNGDKLEITLNEVGSAGKLLVNTTKDPNGTPAASAGADTAGKDATVTIGGETYTGKGSVLTLDSKAGDAEGLIINVKDDIATGNTESIKVDSVGANLQIGANEGQNIALSMGDMRAKSLGVDAIDVSNAQVADKSVTTIQAAIDKVSSERSKLGAYQNRLEHTIANLNTSSENLQASESRIRDVDMAKEMMNFSKNNILSQAAQAMLAQANQQPQGVLQLLR